MEEIKLTNLAIDSLWYLTKEEVDFYNKKVTLTFVVLSEILANIKSFSNSNLSTIATKKLFENIVIAPFSAAQKGIDIAVKYSTEDSFTMFDNTRLNTRGLARTRIIMGIVNNEFYDRKKRNDNHFAVSVPLQGVTLENTPFKGKSLFEIMVEFIDEHPQLCDGDEKMIANSFINSKQHSSVISALNDAFEKYFVKLILAYEDEVNKQGGSQTCRELAYKIYKKLSGKFGRYDFNSKSILSSNFVQDIVNEFKQNL